MKTFVIQYLVLSSYRIIIAQSHLCRFHSSPFKMASFYISDGKKSSFAQFVTSGIQLQMFRALKIDNKILKNANLKYELVRTKSEFTPAPIFLQTQLLTKHGE